MNIGVIGLGRMGSQIAGHILRAGHATSGYDISPDAFGRLPSKGLVCSNSLSDLASLASTCVLSLPGPKEVEATILGPGGLHDSLRPGSVIIDTSTIGACQSRDLAARLSRRGVTYIDCPVTGGVEAAQAASLTAMVGGDEAACESVQPVLRLFASTIWYLGPSGAGSGMKLVIQLIYMCQLTSFFEGLGLADRLGIETGKALSIISGSSARHPTIEKRYDKIMADDCAPRFSIESMVKDLELARAEMGGLGGRPEVTAAVIETLRSAIDSGLGKLDSVALRRFHRSHPHGAVDEAGE